MKCDICAVHILLQFLQCRVIRVVIRTQISDNAEVFNGKKKRATTESDLYKNTNRYHNFDDSFGMHGLQYERPDWGGGRTMEPAEAPLTTAGGGRRRGWGSLVSRTGWTQEATRKGGPPLRDVPCVPMRDVMMRDASRRIDMCAVAAVLVDERITEY